MSLIRWRPERSRHSMLEQFSRMMDDLAKEVGDEGELGEWSPSVNIYDKEGKLVVEAELPGIEKEDIEVHVENGVLTIKGERKKEGEVKDENFYRLERAYGSFSRSFTLPSDVEADKIDASYKDGMLVLTAPRAEAARAKQVEIH